MTFAQGLVLGGSFSEALGLASLFLGIYSDRRNFTKRPSIAQRGRERFRSIAARLLRRPRNVVVAPAAIGIGSAFGSAELDVTIAWPEEVADQIEWLKKRIEVERDNTTRRLAKAADRLNDLRAQTESRMAELEQANRTTEQKFSQYVEDNLTLQFWGGAFIVIGLILTSWGNLIA